MQWTGIVATSVLIGIGSNLDNTSVGIAYGAAGVHVPHRINAIINSIGFVAVTIACFAGDMAARILSQRTASWLAAGALFSVALACWYTAYLHHHMPSGGERFRVRAPGWHEGVVLGIGLSFTNIVSGIGATLSDLRMIWPTIISITLAGYLAIWIGNAVAGRLLARWLNRYAAFVAGLILIAVGLHELM